MTQENAAQSSSEDAVVALFEATHQPIFAYLFRLVNDWELAHDLTQETFVRVVNSAEMLPTITNPRAWVYRIATNVAYTTLKRRSRFAWLPWRRVNPRHLVSDDPTDAVEAHQIVVRALAELPLTYRAPLLLYSHEGLSVREVASVLNLSEGAVKTRLHRAREQFARAYEKEMTDANDPSN